MVNLTESRTAFGEWPLLVNENMNTQKQEGDKESNLRFYVVISIWTVAALALIVLSNRYLEGTLLEIFNGIGIAILSAMVLGLTVHLWLERQIVTDVFRAAVGHILPPELRDEVHWISNFKCITTRCVFSLDLEDIGDGIVKVSIEIESELRNITTKPYKVKRVFTLDDWDIPGKQPEIGEYEYTIEDKPPVKFDGVPKRHPDKIIQIEMEDVELRPGEIIKTFSKGTEYRRTNDRF